MVDKPSARASGGSSMGSASGANGQGPQMVYSDWLINESADRARLRRS